MPMVIETVNAVVQPVAGQLFVIGRVAGIEGEMPNEEEAQSKSGEQAGQEVFVERFGEHGMQAKRNRMHGHCSKHETG